MLLVHDNLIHSNRPACAAAESGMTGDAPPAGKLPWRRHQA
jgi:hypothetical protein